MHSIHGQIPRVVNKKTYTADCGVQGEICDVGDNSLQKG